MGFKCTSLIFSIWCMTIFLACFSLQPTLGFTCGDFGYNCINQRYYQKCDKEKNTRDIKVISVCPRNTICIQSRPNPCQPSKENTLEQIRLEQDQKLATQSSEEKAAVKQIIKEKMSDSAPLGNQDDTNNLKTPSSNAGNQGVNEVIEMKNLGSTTPISTSTTVDYNASSPATPATHPTPHKDIETKLVKEKGSVTEHYTAEEHKEEGHEKTGEHAEEHKEEGHEKSGEHHAKEHKEEEGHEKSGEHHAEEHKEEEGHEKSGEHHAEEHKEEGHEKSGEHHAEEHKEEGHEKSGEHHAEEHKEDHEKTGEHHGEEHKEEHKEGHEKSEEHHTEEHKEDHEKTGEHNGDEHKEEHTEVESDSEAEEHVKHDNAKGDQHAEHGNHEEPKKRPEEHTTPPSKKEIFGIKIKRGFICSNTGTFSDDASDGECFYLCYRNRRSINYDLKAINVCCPEGMFFNSKTHKCTVNEKKMDKTKLSRLKRRRRWRSRG